MAGVIMTSKLRDAHEVIMKMTAWETIHINW